MVSADGSPSLDPAESIMIAAFEGWNDAGSAASGAVDHLARVWRAQEYAALDSEDYHDFQVSRPTVSRNEDGHRIISWPGTVISTTPGPWFEDRRVALVRGIEPSMRWRQFCSDILDLADDLEITTLITCGALLVDSPHTRPLPTFLASENAKTRKRFSLERSDYDGPTGITAVLGHEAEARGITCISMWVGVPHYVAQPPSPKATLALLGSLESIVGTPIELGDLPYEAEAWQRGADEMAEEDEEVAAHVRQLEGVADAVNLPEASGDAIAAEFERFLRRGESGH